MRVGIFSGRFDPPNLGHVLTIHKLSTSYDVLFVPILDYEDRSGCSAEDARIIFEFYFKLVTIECELKFIINNIHFAKITRSEIFHLASQNDINLEQDDIEYLAGNQEVIDNIRRLGIKCRFIPRVTIPGIDQYLFESTKIRNKMKNSGKLLGEIYNIEIKT